MTAATKSLKITTRGALRLELLTVAVAAATTIYKGTLVARNASGYAVPASEDTSLVVVGVARGEADNADGAAAAINVDVLVGCFLLNNSAGGDAISSDDIGRVCYVADDNTVALTSDSGARPIAGIIGDVDSGGVWVVAGPEVAAMFAATPPAGRRFQVTQTITNLATAQAWGVRCNIAAKIVKIDSVIHGALTTGDAVLTGAIGATPITDGAITITQSGSAVGDVDTATPSAANVVAAGDVLNLTKSGANDAAVSATITWTLETI